MTGSVQVSEESRPSVCPLCGGFGFFRKEVPLGHPDFGQAFPCDCTLQLHQKKLLSQLKGFSDLEVLGNKEFVTFLTEPPNYDAKSRENLQQAYRQCLEFAQKPQGWLYLQGRSGCGKTHLAAAICHMLRGNPTPVLFKPVPDLLDLFRSGYSPDSQVSFDRVFGMARDVPVLVLDDMGAHKSTAWASEKLYQLLNKRYVDRNATVFTSNQAVWDYEDRLQSRLSDSELVSRVVIDAPDYRSQRPGAHQGLSLGTLARINSAPLYRDRTFGNFNPEDSDQGDGGLLRTALKEAEQFAANPRSWLVLNGPHGCGKTHLAAAVANEWARQGKSVLFADFTELQDFLRDAVQHSGDAGDTGRGLTDLFNALRNVPALVVDGYAYVKSRRSSAGSERGTWLQNKVRGLLDHRFNTRLPTVITMCIPENEIEDWLLSRTSQEFQQRAVHVTVRQFVPRENGRPSY